MPPCDAASVIHRALLCGASLDKIGPTVGALECAPGGVVGGDNQIVTATSFNAW